jgi:hypothetical protein
MSTELKVGSKGLEALHWLFRKSGRHSHNMKPRADIDPGRGLVNNGKPCPLLIIFGHRDPPS